MIIGSFPAKCATRFRETERERSLTNMAAVYSKKQTKRRINLEKVSSENEKDSCVEESADSLSCEKDSSAESSSAGRALSARSPEPEAREHAQAAAPLQIRIKEEPLEESEYLTVHVDEENWEEQAGRGAHFSGSDERSDAESKWLLFSPSPNNNAAGGPPEHRARSSLTCSGHQTHFSNPLIPDTISTQHTDSTHYRA